MIVYIQPPNIYFEIAAYIHAEGMYGCVTRYLVLYMRFWSTCLFFMKPSLPASPITRCVRYPDRLVPGMYVLPTPPVNPERPVSGTPHLLNVLAPSSIIQGNYHQITTNNSSTKIRYKTCRRHPVAPPAKRHFARAVTPESVSIKEVSQSLKA